ncbi:MAG: AMP-binding protein, partial [Alcaligenaceae bacterium]|nr:AMP-binding protein [Alcaligenaceae bacterium]
MNEPLLSEVDGLTLGQALRRSGARWPDQDFFKTADVSVSFLQFDQRVDQFARALLALGLKRQDHVAVWLGNSLEWALTFCACARIGAVLVPINTRYTASEAGYILAQSDAKALVMTSVVYGLNYLEMLEQIAPSLAEAQHDLLGLKELPALMRVILSEPEHATMQAISVSPLPKYAVNLEALMEQAQAHEQLQAAERAVSVEDVLLICYTSGTTGKPKG